MGWKDGRRLVPRVRPAGGEGGWRGGCDGESAPGWAKTWGGEGKAKGAGGGSKFKRTPHVSVSSFKALSATTFQPIAVRFGL